MKAWQKIALVLGFTAVMVAGCVLALSRAAEAADVAGWSIVCKNSSGQEVTTLTYTGTESKQITCTATAPAGHNTPWFDYQNLHKVGTQWPAVFKYGGKLADGTVSSRSYTIFGSNVVNGDKLEARVYNYPNSNTYRMLMATSKTITISKGSTPPPTGGNAADIINWTTYHPTGWPNEIRLGYSYTATGGDRTEDAVVLTHRSAAVNHIIFSNNTQGRSADTYAYFRVDQVQTFSPWPRHDDYVIRYLHIPSATKYDPATWGILDEVFVGTLPACCSTGQ